MQSKRRITLILTLFAVLGVAGALALVFLEPAYNPQMIEQELDAATFNQAQ